MKTMNIGKLALADGSAAILGACGSGLFQIAERRSADTPAFLWCDPPDRKTRIATIEDLPGHQLTMAHLYLADGTIIKMKVSQAGLVLSIPEHARNSKSIEWRV